MVSALNSKTHRVRIAGEFVFEGAGIITPEGLQLSACRPPVSALGSSAGTHQDTRSWVSLRHDINVSVPDTKTPFVGLHKWWSVHQYIPPDLQMYTAYAGPTRREVVALSDFARTTLWTAFFRNAGSSSSSASFRYSMIVSSSPRSSVQSQGL